MIARRGPDFAAMIARLYGHLSRHCRAGGRWLTAALAGLGVACAAPVPRIERTDAELTVAVARWDAPSGCRLTYRHYLPVGPPRGQALLAPGWLRAAHHLDGLARALARAGITAVMLDWCRAGAWCGRAVREAQDMVALARALGPAPTVYLGHSAGGLRAVLAADLDPRARGAVTLDLVDRQGLGWRVARTLAPPLLGMAGAPSRCNANANGATVFTFAPRARLYTISTARHCDFETPSDGWCAALCPPPPGHNEHENRARIVTAAVAAVVALLTQHLEHWPPPE